MSIRPTPPPLSDEDTALFETLSPELARALYPDQSTAPFRITAIYPRLEGSAAESAAKIEAGAAAHEVLTDDGVGGLPRHKTTFSLRQVEEFHELYHLVEGTIGASEVKLLLNGKSVPLTRELWLPLLWTLRA